MPTARVIALGFMLLSAETVRGADRFVGVGGSDVGTCSASTTPCGSLAYAVTQAASGDTVKISGGSYVANVVIDSSTSLTISGGWSSDFATRDPAANKTSLRGQNFSDVIGVSGSTGDVIALTVDGLTLRRGGRGIFATGAADAVVDLDVNDCIVFANRSGGVHVRARDASAVTATLSATVVTSNVEPQGGGAGVRIEAQGSVPTGVNLVNSRIERNRGIGSTYGGGLVAYQTGSGPLTLDIDGCTFSRNRQIGGAAGGLAALDTSGLGALDLNIRDSVFTRNGASQNGAMYLQVTNLTLENVTITRNGESAHFAGVVEINRGSGTVVNSTISGNRGNSGLTIGGPGAVTLRNTILWGHRPTSAPDLVVAWMDAVVDVERSDIGRVTGPINDLGGNISADPLFVGARDYHLTGGSPCVDTGTCTGAPGTDTEGDPRPTGAGCDMGADEFVP